MSQDVDGQILLAPPVQELLAVFASDRAGIPMARLAAGAVGDALRVAARLRSGWGVTSFERFFNFRGRSLGQLLEEFPLFSVCPQKGLVEDEVGVKALQQRTST